MVLYCLLLVLAFDCVLQTAQHIYVIEFKLNASKEVALNQIQTKNYAEKYLDSDKQVILVGVEFDSEAHNIVDFVTLQY